MRTNDEELFWASFYGYTEQVISLIAAGANVNYHCSVKDDRTPLHEAGNEEIVKILVTKGASVNSIDSNGMTPLHLAARRGNIELTKALIKAGANVNISDFENITPRHYGIVEVLDALIHANADVNIRNNKDTTDTSARNSQQSRITHNKETTSSGESSLPHAKQQIGNKEPFIEFPWIGNPNEFEVILSKGTYKSFDNRVFLSGACNCGKSTLASVLIGDDIPLTWKSTDGLTVYFGRNGINLRTGEMIPLTEDSESHAVFTRILRGQPNILQTKPKQTDKKSQHKSIFKNFFANIRESKRSVLTDDAKAKELPYVQTPKTSVKDRLTIASRSEKTHIIQSEVELKQDVQDEIPSVSKLNHYTVREDILEEVRKGRYIMEISPSDLVDFGGQRSYDMTHQLFVQHRGSFIIMFDGRYDLKEPLKEYPQGDVTSESTIIHWINSILTYCPEGDDIMPMVLFAATHSDFFNQEKAKERKSYFTREVNSLFHDHEQRKHMYLDTVFFINGTNIHDPEIKVLTQQLVKFAVQQLTWGQRRPMAWVPLEMQIDNMRSQNISIITRHQLKYINQLNGDLALSEMQMEDFLVNQHTLGKVMYYKQPGLDGFVIIYTPALVNILRSFITDEMFWPDCTDLKEVLQNMVLTGNIYKSDLWKLWRQHIFNQYLPTEELKSFVTKLLIYLDILIQPKGTSSASEDEMFLVPCIVKTNPPSDFFLHGTTGLNTIVLAYSLAVANIPSALAFKLIGAASNNFLLKEENGKKCIFHKAAVFLVDDDNEIRMWLDENRVMVNLINKTSLQFLSPDIATSIQECLTKALESSLTFYFNSYGKKIDPKEISKMISIEVGVVCKNCVCLLNLQDASQGTEWTCAIQKVNHQKKYPMYWFFNQKQDECNQKCKGLDTRELKTIPSIKHLVRLACMFEISLFGEFIIHLGLKTKEYSNIQYQYDRHGIQIIMFMALVQWKKDMETKIKRPCLKNLRDALTEVNMNHHILCQIFREDTSLYDISESRLQSPIADNVLTELPKHIGNCVFQLGIELGLTVEDVEEAMYNYPKVMYSQIEHILHKWKRTSQTPTVFALMKVLQYVKSGGFSYLCQQYNVGPQD